MATTFDAAVKQAMSLADTLKPAYLANFKSAMNAVAPGASTQIASNLKSLLSGTLPTDVLESVRRNAAEMNISQGRFGQAATSSLLGKMGSTSLDLMTKGASMLKSFMPDMPNIQSLITGAFEGEQYDINAALSMGKLAEQSREFDISSALDKSKLDLQKYGMDVSNEQFKQTLAQNLLMEREKTASEKFLATLTANQNAARLSEQSREFDVSKQWEKTTDTWKKQFADYAGTLMQKQIANKDAEAKASSDLMGKFDFTPTVPISVNSGGSRTGLQSDNSELFQTVADEGSPNDYISWSKKLWNEPYFEGEGSY